MDRDVAAVLALRLSSSSGSAPSLGNMAAFSAAASAASAARVELLLARERAAMAADRDELLLARERAAMANEDARSYVAQRHFVGSVQVPQAGPIMTWEALYELRHEDLHLARAAMRTARRLLQAGRHAAALAVMAEELGSSDEEEAEEEAEEEEPEEDELVLSVQPFTGAAHQLVPPPAFQAFGGTAHRLG